MSHIHSGPSDKSRCKTPTIVILACLIIIVAGMKVAAPLLNPLFLSLFAAIVCWPSLLWLNRKGVPSGIAVTLIISGLVVIILVLGAYVTSSVNQFTRSLPVYQANLLQQTSGLKEWMDAHELILPAEMELTKMVNAGKVMRFAGGVLKGLGDVFTDMFFILLTVIFLLFETYALPLKIRHAFGDSNFDADSKKIIDSLNQYLSIKALTSLVTGLFIAIWVAVLGVDFPVLWGVIAFILNFVPNIGSIIAAIPTVLLALVQLGGNSAFLAALGYIIVNLVVGNVWEPRIMGKGLGLSTLVVFVSLTFWGWVFGPVGMLLSVPFTMIAKIIMENEQQTQWIAILLGSVKDLEDTKPDES
jgi:AI-2 transport protein TqsA